VQADGHHLGVGAPLLVEHIEGVHRHTTSPVKLFEVQLDPRVLTDPDQRPWETE
jgi:hypothetical protein